MNTKCRTTKKNTNCSPSTVGNSTTALCKPFNICLGLGRTLVFDGSCLHMTENVTLPDGQYNSIVVENGCIVDATDNGVPQYTPAPCAPSATDCSGSDSSSLTLSGDAANLSELVGGQLLTTIHFGDSSGVTVTGAGTANDPIRIQVSESDNSVYVQSGSPNVIAVEGDGEQTSPYTISLNKSGVAAGTYKGFTVDLYGRVTDYDPTSESDFAGVNDGTGTTATYVAGMVTVDLTNTGVSADTYTLGAYNISIDLQGRVTSTSREITLDGGTYTLGAYSVTVNAFGSITKIEESNSSDAAIVGTFIAAYRGDSNSEDTERQMTFTTELSGIFHVEYRGYIGETTLDPGVSMTLPAGYVLSIDDITLVDPLVEVMGSFDKTDGEGKNAVMCIRGTTTKALSTGQHTVTVTAPDATITQRDGFMRVELVERGA